jgi:myo-inositol-1-phosphate synthase
MLYVRVFVSNKKIELICVIIKIKSNYYLCHNFTITIIEMENKGLPEKIVRYLVFGNWLGKNSQLSDTDTKKIQDLFHLNSTHEEQISFYTQFHEDYKSIKKSMSKNIKKNKREKKIVINKNDHKKNVNKKNGIKNILNESIVKENILNESIVKENIVKESNVKENIVTESIVKENIVDLSSDVHEIDCFPADFDDSMDYLWDMNDGLFEL